MSNPIFPTDLFPHPEVNEDGSSKWQFYEEPLNKKLLELEVQNQEGLRRAMTTNLTEEFFTSLYFKATKNPPENITIEIKGETRSGKSTGGIFLGNLISKWWGLDFTEDNILPNQSELLYKLKDAKFGETFVIDEQLPETYGEGVSREAEQLGTNMNICAKQCNNLIFIYPPHFASRNAPYGLETIAKDTKNKYVKFFYHDLRRKAFGYGGIWPQGFVYIPKLQDKYYQDIPKSKWSKFRNDNFIQRRYDFDSLLEEKYEIKKNAWIAEIRNLDSGVRNKKKETIAEELARDDKFMSLKSNGEREAYLQILMNHGKIMEFAKSELATIVGMAKIIGEFGDVK